jgi:AraC-like DNA-binding protein
MVGFTSWAKEPHVGDSTMDAIAAGAKGRVSGHLMLITPERVFYAGLLGRPRRRCSGAFHIYVAIEGGLRLAPEGACETYGELAVVPPYLQHTISSDHRAVLCLTIEPESVRAGAFDDLAARLSGPERPLFARRIRAAYAQLLQLRCRDAITSAELDRMCLGETLPARTLDPRVVKAIAQIGRFSGEPVTAESCAVEIGLSASRFLHLFKEETGMSFRSFRAWKRARHLLHFANQDLNLAHLAQQIGYPDSTHFSHSIRRFYGLKPRAIFSGSRDLAIYRSGRASDSGLTQEAG